LIVFRGPSALALGEELPKLLRDVIGIAAFL
jgi:hypothetical protein